MARRADAASATGRVAAALVAVVVLVALAGCWASSSSGSRATLYESIDDLARDSAAIVVGTVVGQHQDAAEATTSTVEVTSAPFNPALGQNLGGVAEIAVGDMIEVRQDAVPTTSPVPILRQGTEYLLFVTPTMLEGDAADQYFVTGAVAGIYERDGDEFRRVVTDSGDDLPDVITSTGANG